MSVSSTIYITKEQAQNMVKEQLMFQYKLLVDLAVENMYNFDLTLRISDDYTNYVITDNKEVE